MILRMTTGMNAIRASAGKIGPYHGVDSGQNEPLDFKMPNPRMQTLQMTQPMTNIQRALRESPGRFESTKCMMVATAVACVIANHAGNVKVN